MRTDLLPAALADLDAGNRALLDLSLRRGVSDAEIATLLGKGPEEVSQGREDVLEHLCHALGTEGDDRRERVRVALLELPEDAWQARPPKRATSSLPPVPRSFHRIEQPGGELHGVELHEAAPLGRLSRAGAILAALGLIAAVVLVIALVTGGGDDKEGSPEPTRADRAPAQPAPPPGDGAREPEPGARTVGLQPLGGGSVRGTATLNEDGDRLAISIKGLPKPDGSYEIWLYSSIVDSKSLGSFRDTKIELDARLPDNLEDYRFVDVSLEPADGNPNHSGDSVMRAPVDDLLVD